MIVAIILFAVSSLISYLGSRAEQNTFAVIKTENSRSMLRQLWRLTFTDQARFENPVFSIDNAATAARLTLLNYMIYMDVIFGIYVFALVIISANPWMILPVIIVCGISTLIVAYGMFRVTQIRKSPPSYSKLINFAARIFEFSIHGEHDKLLSYVNIENERIQKYQQNIILFQLRMSMRAGIILIGGSYGILSRVIDFTSIESFAFYSYMVVDLLIQLNSVMDIAANQIIINIASLTLVKLYSAKLRPYREQVHLINNFQINVKDLTWVDDSGINCTVHDWNPSQGEVWLLDGESIKTTSLLRVIAGIQDTTNSRILSDSKQITWDSLFSSSVFASTDAPLPRGTVMDSFRMLTDDPDMVKIQYYLDMVELVNKLDNNVVTLSGGEKARLHIARNMYRVYLSNDTPYPTKMLLLSEVDRGIDSVRSERIVTRIIADSKNLLVIGIAHKTNIRRLFSQVLEV
jgi:ABC-type transport system involved in cytochrome bd biosynthesis fused ATPase/permease subunit